MKTAFAGLAVLLVIFVVGIAATTESTSAAPGSAAVSLDEYGKVEPGMSYREVANIVGAPGVESSTSQVEGYRTVLYVWQGERPASNMVAYFQNGELISKAQVGLR